MLVLPNARPTGPFQSYRGPKLIDDGPLAFSVTRFALANATALPKPNPYTLATLRAESALQISHLDIRSGAPLRLVSSFDRSSSHIRKFVAEATGLGICTAVAHQRWGWGGRILNLDSLPLTHPLVAGAGPRPDLAYRCTGQAGGWVAGEARGRTDAVRNRMSRDEYDRGVELDRWAARVGAQPGWKTPKWFMAWSYITGSGTEVHYYDPGDPFHLTNEEADHYAFQIEEALWASEQATYGHLQGVPVRGGWSNASSLGKQDQQTWLFVGVLAKPIANSTSLERLQVGSERDRSAFGGFEWSVTGRLVCALAQGEDEPPDANAFARLLESALTQIESQSST